MTASAATLSVASAIQKARRQHFSWLASFCHCTKYQMSKAAALPEEIFRNIFSYSDSAAELGEFRAVCKSWDTPAAKAMFGRKISISSETGALKLYRHLFKDPSKIPLIRHMHFELDGTKLSFIFEELLRLALTPTVERVTGDVKDGDFFKTIFDIADKSPIKYDKIEELPAYIGDTNLDVSIGKHLMVKNHLHNLHIGLFRNDKMGNFIKQLDQFPKLSTLILSGAADELKEIEEVFKGCPHLTYIEVKDLQLKATTNIMPKNEINAWLAANVQKHQLATTLEISSTCRPELLEYLTYRYSKTKKIVIKGRLWFPNNSTSLNDNNFGRILDAIKDIPARDLTFILPNNTKMKNAIQFFKTRQESPSYDIEEIDGEEKLVVKIT